MGLFRLLYKNLESEVSERGNRQTTSNSSNSQEYRDGSAATNNQVLGRKQTMAYMEPITGLDREEGVGDVEGSGFGVGLAPSGKGTNLPKTVPASQPKPIQSKKTAIVEEDALGGDNVTIVSQVLIYCRTMYFLLIQLKLNSCLIVKAGPSHEQKNLKTLNVEKELK